MLPGAYTIVRLEADAVVPEWASKGEFASITRTADELSIVCLAGNLPRNVNTPEHWTCLKLEGPFPFSLTGVLLSFIEPLSTNEIPIFAVSTYDTDYVLIQEEYVDRALSILDAAGHQLRAK
jgi:uncharacterized protein